MVETTGWLDCDDGAKLFLRRWSPGEKPRAVLHVVHGMAEHSLRYRRLAEALCARGFDVWAADMRGHGKTADPSVNGEGKGGLLGHTADKNGFFRVVEDLRILSRHIAARSAKPPDAPVSETLPGASSAGTSTGSGGLPFFIMGHSWGSFLVQAYIEDPEPSVPLSGCILSGTRGPGGISVAAGVPVLAFIALFKGKRRHSKIAHALSTGSFSKPFRPNRTPFDWLSRDEKEVDGFIADPLSGQLCSSGFYRGMTGGLAAIHKKAAMKKISPQLPVYIFCGSADPVGEMGAGPTRLVNTYRLNGLTDLEFVIYPDARHEPLNETNRDEVTEDLLNWLGRHIQ